MHFGGPISTSIDLLVQPLSESSLQGRNVPHPILELSFEDVVLLLDDLLESNNLILQGMLFDDIRIMKYDLAIVGGDGILHPLLDAVDALTYRIDSVRLRCILIELDGVQFRLDLIKSFVEGVRGLVHAK